MNTTELEQSITQQKENIAQLSAQYLAAKRAYTVADATGDFPNQELLTSSKKDLDEAVSELSTLQNVMRALSPQSTRATGDLKKKQECRKHVVEAVKTFGNNRFYGRTSDNAREFWNEFKTFVLNQNYEDSEVWEYAVPILKSLVKAPNATLWFQNSVIPKLGSQFTLAQLEELFIDGWVDTITKSLEEIELHSFA